MNKESAGLVLFTKNEERSLGELIDEVLLYLPKEDVFVVDGHSTDNSVLVAKQRGVSVILDDGQGKGSAIQVALKDIERDILIFMDSDGSHRPQEIPLLLESILKDKSLAIVIGSRFKGKSDELGGSFNERLRFFANYTGTLLVNLIFRVKLTDIQNGFRGVRTGSMQSLLLSEKSFAIEQEMVIKCLKKKMKIAEVPSWELRRKFNVSHVIPREMFYRYVSSFIKNVVF